VRPIAHAIAASILVLQPVPANAAEITVWTARAIATVLKEIGPQFEQVTGHRLNLYSGLPVDFQKRARAGGSFDVLVSGSSPVDQWIQEGRLVADTRTDIACSGIGVEVRAGARRPDISTVEAFKAAVLNAQSIGFLRVGSGIHVASVLERLGIAEAVRPRVRRPDRDIVSELVAKGDIELGIVVITQIVTTPGVELVGPLPPELQSQVVFTAAIATDSKVADAAKQLIEFLTGPTAIPVLRAQGMESAAQR
jgi:molybdate transport system substrate-binding protein